MDRGGNWNVSTLVWFCAFYLIKNGIPAAAEQLSRDCHGTDNINYLNYLIKILEFHE